MITCAERFYDKNAGPFDDLLKLIKIVRETVPEGSHIMGFSLPYAMGTDENTKSYNINLFEHNLEKTNYVDLFTEVEFEAQNGNLKFELEPHDSVCLMGLHNYK